MLLAAAPVALAGPPAPPTPLSAEDQALADQAVDYLQGLTEAKGRFEQTDYRGGVSRGEIYLDRPGKARFAYDPPSSLLVVADGHSVWRVDPRLGTVNHYPIGATPLGLFLAKKIKLDTGITITGVQRAADGFSLTARDAHHPGRGEITLSFSQDPIRLRVFSMTDSRGRTTRLALTALEPVSGLSDSLFAAPEAEAAQ
jgi:outer membrane lipoprotein-sorting protein